MVGLQEEEAWGIKSIRWAGRVVGGPTLASVVLPHRSEIVVVVDVQKR